MSEIREIYMPAPVERVEAVMGEDEHTLGLYECKRLVEDFISKDVPVSLRRGTYEMNVNRGIYILASMGEKLSAIALLRAQSNQVYIRSLS